MKVLVILLVAVSVALTNARPTFDKIAEAILNVIDEEIDPYHQRYAPTHPNYQHGYRPVQQYPAGPLVGGYYQQPRPHAGYPVNNYQQQPPPAGPYPPNYDGYGNYVGYGYQSPPYGADQYGGGYRQPAAHHNYNRGY